MDNVRRNAIVERVFWTLPIVTGGLALLAWLGSGKLGWVVPGAVLATLITRSLLRGPDRAKTWVFIVLGYLFLVTGGSVGMVGASNAGVLALAQLLWGFTFLVSMIALPIVRGGYSRAVAKDQISRQQRDIAARKAREVQEKEDRIAEKRRQELEHAARIARQRKWKDQASGPGTITGFEPQELENIVLAPHPHMYGVPGAGLSGSGFGESNIKLGQLGELNFAKVLQSEGMLDSFASFWSVHMPDAQIGASAQFNTDIDCILVSRDSVWLIDVKNYVQGAVTWHRETGTHEATGKPVQQLIAVDNETGGYVGKPRNMSRNMQLAAERFTQRFEESGLSFTVKPVVVMMPRRDGLGVIDNVTWPDNIPAAPLPRLLHWIKGEQSFNPGSEDSLVITGILDSLIKDDSGSALKLGERPASTRAAAKAAPVGGSTSDTRASGAVAEVVGISDSPSEKRQVCNSCNGDVESDWTFCYNCGASF